MPPAITPDVTALDALYRDHRSWLQAWLHRRMGCSETAADVAQDTFVRVLLRRELPALNEPRSFLATIARGLMVDHFRRAHLERAYLQELAALPEAHQPSAEDRALMIEALLEIERLLSGLSARARRAFLLSRLDGLSHAEIAAQVGVSVPRVRQYLAQGLRCCYLGLHGEAQ